MVNTDDLKPEYEFDYSKAQRNRFPQLSACPAGGKHEFKAVPDEGDYKREVCQKCGFVVLISIVDDD